MSTAIKLTTALLVVFLLTLSFGAKASDTWFHENFTEVRTITKDPSVLTREKLVIYQHNTSGNCYLQFRASTRGGFSAVTCSDFIEGYKPRRYITEDQINKLLEIRSRLEAINRLYSEDN